jgi:uncharacterized lipoprotein YmbA
MKNLFVVTGLALLLAACSSGVTSKVTVVDPSTIEIPPLPEKTALLQVQWQVLNHGDLVAELEKAGVITKEQATQMLANMPKNDEYAVFALNAQQLANLVHNLEELKRYIDEQNIVIKTFIAETQATRQAPAPQK